MHNLAESYKALTLYSPISLTASDTGTGIDVEKYEDDAVVVLTTGAQAGSTETTDVVVEGSEDGTNYDTATPLATFTQFTGTGGDNKVAAQRVNLFGIKKIRLKVTKSSTGAGLIGAAVLVRDRIGGASVNSATLA